MNIRKFKSDKNALIAEGNRIVSSSDDARFIRKVTIVNLLLRGMSAKLLADASGETDRTLSNWADPLMSMGLSLSVHVNSLGVRNPSLNLKKKILKSP